MAAQASSGSLELTAQMLARLGYAVTLNTSAGGTLHSLKHRYLTATRTSLAGS
jgi:predicted subunit of tRNA(5-methylaminomethyl-2-thiouridylate) methyltransferase